MTVEPINAATAPAEKSKRSDTKFPTYALAESVEVARMLHTRSGGRASADHLASYLGYKSTNNGAYLARISAARTFALIERANDVYILTERATKILSPTYQTDKTRGLTEAFMGVPLFKKVFEDFRGKELPSDVGMKNALRTHYGVIGSRIDIAYKVLMDSADTAGYFEARGARTHLISPSATTTSPAAPAPKQGDREVHGQHDAPTPPLRPPVPPGPPLPPAPPQTPGSTHLSDAKAKYIGVLVKMLDSKMANGEIDDGLMERIERLLGE